MALVVGAAALFAATLCGITGMGTGIIALPILAFAFGVREAVPIVTLAMMFNTVSRAVANRAFIFIVGGAMLLSGVALLATGA